MQQQVTVTANPGPPVYTSNHGNSRDVRESYQAQSSVGLGIVSVVVGVLAIFFNIGAYVTEAANSTVSHGVWSGAFFILTGAFGIIAGKGKKHGAIVAFLSLSIISLLFCVLLLAFATEGIHDDRDRICYFVICFSFNEPDNERAARIAMNALLTGLALLQAIVAIWSSALGCASLCCDSSSNRTVVQTAHTVQYINSPGQPQVMVITGGGQQGVYPPQGPGYPPQQYMAQPYVPQPATQQHWPQPGYQQQQPAPAPEYAPPVYSYGPGAEAGQPQANAPPVPTKQVF